MLKERNLKSATWGHIGNNHLHVNILPENEEEYIRGKELYVEWASIVTQMGGAVSAEHGVGKLKSGMLTIMYGDKYISEMRKLKAQLDPIEILGIGSMFSVEEGDVK
jgi:D-lactate dehydrogenase (cytochrome)